MVTRWNFPSHAHHQIENTGCDTEAKDVDDFRKGFGVSPNDRNVTFLWDSKNNEETKQNRSFGFTKNARSSHLKIGRSSSNGAMVNWFRNGGRRDRFENGERKYCRKINPKLLSNGPFKRFGYEEAALQLRER
ncbi:hypothetical protein TNIN_339171 [Trichonephila inaurata madagascariensis]|uniref:Uncharacterized protein n=1 Tax=Trichonephila inaurata madagascariensis TaxID=2747483 RepID=A0A8X7CCF5_9ARAC|nr:hypothetical protein TNIN_339171 [Trichonephila inaurata madagascariensis]